MDTDDRLLIAKTEDLFVMCEKHCAAKFSSFLSGGELALIEDKLNIPYGFNTMIFGGYNSAERKIYGVFPEWEEAKKEEFPITAVRFDVPKFRTLTHRDYLGTIMSLGIDRNKTGDILIDDGGAYAFVMSDIGEYIARNVTKIANIGVKGHIVEMGSFTPKEAETVERQCVCASLRVDAVIAAALNISRGAAEKLVASGGVKVNHREVTDRSGQIEEGTLVSVRNYGCFILKDTGNNTRKGRLHITVSKFV